ncbi:MAG TPA: 5,6-dimethylbenzimidazole synthase, partial [Candidatus Binataceae bacterium]|nr:5,6-dimethylbenzimidazole synthase [Candidatus Binataceae bacterium]
PDPVPDEVLARMLVAAHHAASVGFTQPWDFIIVRDLERRRAVQRIFAGERSRNAAQFSGARREKFLELKLEGILDSPLNLIITCEPDREGRAILGKTSIREVEIYSACLAVGNLWLAARAEGVGVGWVSILRNDEIRRIFSVPDRVIPIAYLCVGYTDDFPAQPLLQSAEWAERIHPRTLIHFDSWARRDDTSAADGPAPLADLVQSPAIWRELFPGAQVEGFGADANLAAPDPNPRVPILRDPARHKP